MVVIHAKVKRQKAGNAEITFTLEDTKFTSQDTFTSKITKGKGEWTLHANAYATLENSQPYLPKVKASPRSTGVFLDSGSLMTLTYVGKTLSGRFVTFTDRSLIVVKGLKATSQPGFFEKIDSNTGDVSVGGFNRQFSIERYWIRFSSD